MVVAAEVDAFALECLQRGDLFRGDEPAPHVAQLALRPAEPELDLLVSPTLACLAVDNATDGNTLGPAEIEGEPVDRLIGWCMTYLINFIGYPAASIPAGLADNGLPVGMQIVGKRYADADVIAASAEFERIQPWIDTYRLCKL